MTRTERRRAKRRRALRLAACSAVLCATLVMVAATTTGGDEAPAGKAVFLSAVETERMLNTLTTTGPLVVDTPAPELWTEEEVEAVAKTVFGEAAVTGSDMEMSAVAWCILNRVDSDAYADSIMEVVTQPRQFHGYHEDYPVDEHIEALVLDVFERWADEKQGREDVGRTLPADYLFFWGDGEHNHFTTEYQSDDVWDWSLPNPYED